ncbi:MAG TPA: AMP-binding protein [Bacteroidota bacterium]|nr:AMP-binding protein [Bacteroidota bacterium]
MSITPVYYDVPTITSIQDLVLRSARVHGEKLAMEDLKDTPVNRLTFAALLRMVLKFGTALQRLGIKERSHIAVIGENRVQWALAYLTGMCFNDVVVPIDRNLPINDILNILHESDSVAVVYPESLEPIFDERRGSLHHLRYYINMDAASSQGDMLSMMELIQKSPGCDTQALPDINPEDLAEVIFTSGSLGRAKGVMLSQANLASNLMAMTKYVNITEEDRFLMVLPIHHTYACTCGLLCPLYKGASVHFAKSLKTIVEDLQQVRATILLGVPLLYDKMFKRIYKSIAERKVLSKLIGSVIKATDVLQLIGWKASKRQVFKEIHDRFGGSVRLFIAGGAAQDPLVAKGLREFGFNFLQGYGLTETSPILTLNQLENFRDDSAGIPLPGTTLKINEPDAEGVGEIWARGPGVMLGYYKNEQATRDTFEGDWFKTGDLGKIDADGFLHICGRKKNVIISKSGKNVYPEELEDLLNRSSFILESLVFGEEDKKLGEIIAAQIVVDAEAFIELSERKGIQITRELMHETIADEIESINRELPSFKQIRKFYIRDAEFEKTTTQKVKRYLVKPLPTMQH